VVHAASIQPEVSGEHKVMVRGQQALELRCFLQAAQPELPDVVVLDWLRSGRQESTVMAERVTVLANRECVSWPWKQSSACNIQTKRLQWCREALQMWQTPEK
jgi:hypothetical protein